MKTNKREITKMSKSSEILKKLHQDVESFKESGELENYFKFCGKFINRSFNNQMLIYFAKPEATFVKGYKQWIDDHKRIVVACTVCRSFKNADCSCEERTAPTRIEQLAPMIKKTENKINGEEEEILFFRVVYVFDIADTEALEGGEEIPEITSWVDFDIENADELEARFVEIINNNSFSFRYDSWDSKNLNGFCDFQKQEIVVSADRPKAQQIKTIIHEIGHMFAHNRDEYMKCDDPRGLREVEAESIAYVVANMLGLDTSDYSIGYVASWSDSDEGSLKKSIGTVTKTAEKIMDLLGS